jgi:hypothetical protein
MSQVTLQLLVIVLVIQRGIWERICHTGPSHDGHMHFLYGHDEELHNGIPCSSE